MNHQPTGGKNLRGSNEPSTIRSTGVVDSPKFVAICSQVGVAGAGEQNGVFGGHMPLTCEVWATSE